MTADHPRQVEGTVSDRPALAFGCNAATRGIDRVIGSALCGRTQV
jgi:hypothetical protein